eukprot:CAMPEP_0178912372 /NCGR_PEP_ID=MMETSP0786-20121207/10225_1 /TAXON_ID=186022 /ORGANISM="Thalassionema frauenfeldii, Strain CCMP 1798" /LENGTH=504 /DNA_ID=CAMNT_0020584945 /DNA_START=68 /DNA_END=1582 /DNA_ORIENTATION=-
MTREEDISFFHNKSHEYKALVQDLFSFLTSSRLLKSSETFPQDLNALKSLHNIVGETIAGNRQLQVAVFGGSLTAGHGCLENPLGVPSQQSFLKRQLPCAWPARFEHLVNSMFGKELINVTNMAMAATTSDVGATVVEYQLWPPALLPNGPDIIIASFATNDALAEATQSEIYQNMQSLITAIQAEKNCDRNKMPLLIYMDDFIAWPGEVKKWLDFHHDLHELSDWYGFGFLSYANVLRDVVHSSDMFDKKNSYFKGEWEKKRNGKISPNPHPGITFHITMSWIVTFSMLQLAVHTCSILDLRGTDDSDTNKMILPSIPRPPLNSKLLTEEIPKQWKDLENSEQKRCSTFTSGNRCAFVWVANRVSEFRTAAAIEGFLKRFLDSSSGWKAEGNSYRSKHGYVAKEAAAKFSLTIPSLESNVRFLTVLALKSYGSEWEGSRLKMSAMGKEFFMDGYHNSSTSVIIPHKFDLAAKNSVKRGGNITVDFQMVGGKTFKITGMAFCSQ